MKRKLLFSFMVLALICSSCKKDNDVMGTIVNLGDKNMRAMYSLLTVDTTKMVSYVTQYVLNKTENTGIHYNAVAGSGKPLNYGEITFSWVQHGINDKLFYDLDFIYADSVVKMQWAHNALYNMSRVEYPASLINIYDYFKTIDGTFAKLNNEWNHRDSTIYQDTLIAYHDYLAWKDKTLKNINQETLDNWIAFFDQQWVKDTIHWYNETFGKTARDTVFYKPVSGKTGLYNAVISDSIPSKQEIQVYDTIGNATENFVSARFYIGSDFKQMFDYSKHVATYSRECYKAPTSDKAKAIIMDKNIKDATWTMGTITNTKKFMLVSKGKVTTVSDSIVAGVHHQETIEKMDSVETYQVEAFATKDTTMTFAGDKMTYVR